MASSSSHHPPGSRAIQIPHMDPQVSSCRPTMQRPRRHSRYSKQRQHAESSDTGSSSLGSEQDSSWPSSPAGDRFPTAASPATRLPLAHSKFPQSLSSSSSCTNSPSQQSLGRKDKAPLRHQSTTPPPVALPSHPNLTPRSRRPILSSTPSSNLGPRMLTSTSYKSVNLNDHRDYYDPNDPPRLITYTKSAQGFTWNDELFLPSYLLGGRRGSRRGWGRRYRAPRDSDEDDEDDNMDEDHCPVTEIFVTDEEAQRMMP